MSNLIVCRICLRTDIKARDLTETLADFHDEICNFDIYPNKSLKYCLICEYQLKKFYNFRLRILQANKVLKTWLKKMKNPENLYKQLPLTAIAVCTPEVHEYQQSKEPFVKTENHDNSHYILETVSQNEHITSLHLSEVVNNPEQIETIKNEFEFREVSHEFVVEKSNVLEIKPFDIKIENLDDDNSETLNIIFDDHHANNQVDMIHDDPETSDSVDDDNDKRKIAKPMKNVNKKRKSSSSDCDNGVTVLKKDKILNARLKFLRNKDKLKVRILEILGSGQFNDLGENIKMDKELFIKIFNRCDKIEKRDMRMLAVKLGSNELRENLTRFLRSLLKRYNPQYETVFDIEYLDTDDKKIQEFNRRKDTKRYQEAPYKCQLCYRGFDSQRHLDFHNKWHEPQPNDVSCNICPMRFTSRSTFFSHRNQSHVRVYSCKLCPLVTYHFSVMINHYNQHKGAEYCCATCLSVFTNKATLNNHVRQAHRSVHACATCARTFVSQKGLLFHRKRKHKDEAEAKPKETVTCVECNITFDAQKVYFKHVRTMHARSPVYKCRVCQTEFDSIEALRQHKLQLNHQKILLKRDLRPLLKPSRERKVARTCAVCEVAVPISHCMSLYRHHMEIHPDVPYNSLFTNTMEYLCEQCGNTFRERNHFLDHQNLHIGVKPYACTECPSRFALRRNLVHHIQRHRPPKFQCKQCGKMFLTYGNLYTHTRIHVGDRRHKCEICSKGFLHAASLRAHVKGVHNHIRRLRKSV